MPQHLAPFRIYDALYIAHHTPGYACLGREALCERVARTLQRHDVRHAVLVGKHGVGKTTLIGGLAATFLQRKYKGLRALPMVQLDTAHLIQRFMRAADAASLLTHFEQALAALPPCVLVIDDIHTLLAALPDAASVERVVAALTASPERQAIFTCAEESWSTTQEKLGARLAAFEVIPVDELPADMCQAIVHDRARYIAGRHRVRLQPDVPEAIFLAAHHLSGLAQPARSLHLFDEVCAAAALEQRAVVTRANITSIVSVRTGQSAASLRGTDSGRLRQLRTTLAQHVIGQPHIIDLVASAIERGWLGLKNPQRPLGSFLFLGPSGVGKTEMARVIAKEVYGTDAAFIRIDMSEYAEPHTVQRLIGAPPGYVGYEAGGQLTSAVLKQPFSLILLDEIEKADPTVFDIFLQILEDGRLTDGQGTTVDFRKTIIIATSNIGVETIIRGWLRNEEVTAAEWRERNLVPELTKRFRLEFLNRWEGLAVFAPLSEESLYAIAELELQKIAERVKHHRVAVKLPPAYIQDKIKELSDPRFGARPLKRWLENTVETELAQYLLTHSPA